MPLSTSAQDSPRRAGREIVACSHRWNVAVQTIEPGALLALVASRPLQFEAALEPGTFCPLWSGKRPLAVWLESRCQCWFGICPLTLVAEQPLPKTEGSGEETGATMPEASDGSEGSTGNVSNQLALLVPTFDPSKDDLQVSQQKVALLLEAWPTNKYTELAARLILNCAGSAFKKLQLHQSELRVNDRKSIQRIIELLGGHWGQIDLEKKYEFAERALYKCNQKSDESADSYLARADIMWTELNSKKFALSDLQAYVTLRGSVLSPEDKKRVLIDADVVDKGELTVKRVSSAIRMLGAGFFQEITAGRRTTKLKTYDQATLVTEDFDEDLEPAMAAETMEDDDQAVETLAQEGDDDATLVMDFENAAAELLQTDEELASAYTAQMPGADSMKRCARGDFGLRLPRENQECVERWKRQVFQATQFLQENAATEDSGISMQTVQSSWSLESGMPKSSWLPRFCCQNATSTNDVCPGGWISQVPMPVMSCLWNSWTCL